MFTQKRRSKETLLGLADVNRNINPTLVSTIRRHDPDMTSPEPYFAGLTGTSLIVQLAGDFAGTITVPFVSLSYPAAITLINMYSPSNLQAQDQDGFLKIRNLNGGNNNTIKVMPCTAASIFGFNIDPHPASISYAGEIGQTLPTIYENPTQQSTMISQNEAVSRQNINRAIASISSIFEPIINDLEKEITIPKSYDINITGTSFTISGTDRLFINANSNITVNPGADILDNFIDITDTDNCLVFDASGNRVRVTSITYGTLTSAATSFSAWATADGKSIFGPSSHWNKVKTTGTIVSITGNTIICSGTTFITSLVAPNDTIKLTGATNNSPFNHNGEFLVEAVISEIIIQVKPKGISDYNYSSVNTPSCLNPNRVFAEIFGSVTVIVGKHLPLTMPSGSITFNLTASLPSATYRVTLPIGRTTRNLLSNDLTQTTINSPFGKQLELGSKLITTLANALKPRIISKPNSDTSLTLFAEFKNGTYGTRIYTQLNGGIQVVSNGIWDGTSYTQEDGTKDVIVIKEDGTLVSLGSTTNQLSINNSTGITTLKMINDFIVNDGTLDVLTIPKFDGTPSSQSILKAGLKIGTGFSTDNQHLIEKINYTCNTSATKYTLLSETILTNSRRREYVLGDGSCISTVNAKWGGTNWVKDYAGPSSKLLVVTDNTQFFSHNTSTTPFTDTAWTNKEEIKDFQLNEDFLCVIAGTGDTVGLPIGPLFSIQAATNTTTYSTNSVAGVFGEITLQSAATTGAFSCRNSTNPIYIGSVDFEMRVKINVLRVNTLSGIDIGIVNGLIVGNNTGDSNNLTFKVSGGGTWNYQVGTNLIDTMVSALGQCLLIIKRSNGIVGAYINGTQYDSRSFTNSLIFTPEVHVKGTSTGSSQDIFSIDFVKLGVDGVAK